MRSPDSHCPSDECQSNPVMTWRCCNCHVHFGYQDRQEGLTTGKKESPGRFIDKETSSFIVIVRKQPRSFHALDLAKMRREYYPLEALPAWAKFNSVAIDGVLFGHMKSESDGIDKGAAVVAAREQSGAGAEKAGNVDRENVLIRVPSEVILSLEGVANYMKSDRYLREVLETLGDFGRVCGAKILLIFFFFFLFVSVSLIVS